METIWFWAAGVVTIIGVLIHVFPGGKMFVRPFLANDFPKEQKWMAYFACHFASVAFIFMAAGFVAAVALPEHKDYAVIATAFAGSIVATALFICVKRLHFTKGLSGDPAIQRCDDARIAWDIDLEQSSNS